MKFNVGDRVKYVGDGLYMFEGKVSASDVRPGLCGVVKIAETSGAFPFEVLFDGHNEANLWPMREQELDYA
jgi:hypothetical protein